MAPKKLEKKSIEISKQIPPKKKRDCVIETNSKWLNSFALRSVWKTNFPFEFLKKSFVLICYIFSVLFSQVFVLISIECAWRC